jgi:hypothetical protein
MNIKVLAQASVGVRQVRPQVASTELETDRLTLRNSWDE